MYWSNGNWNCYCVDIQYIFSLHILELEHGDLNGIKLDLSWIGSIMCLGAMFVCIPIGYLADWIGRKLAVLFIIIPFVIGWVLIVFTQHASMLLLGRFLTGMAGGAFSVVGPLYTSEIAQKEIRGILGTFMQLFITIGILYSNLLGWLVPMVLFCILCLAVPIIFGLLFMFQPESPIFLIKKKKKEQALKAFSRLRGKEYDPSVEITVAETEAIKEEELKGQFTEQLISKPGWKSSLICFSLMFFQQFSGINAVMFYSGSIFKEAASSVKPELCVCIVGAVHVVATLFSAWSMNKFGRKILLRISADGMSFSTLILGGYFLIRDKHLMSKSTIESLGWLPLLSLILFIIAFALGMGPIPWLISSEIFPPAIMARMSSFANMFNWFLAFVVTVGYEPLSKALGSYVTFFLFTIVSGTGELFVLCVIPETKGKSVIFFYYIIYEYISMI